jgi:hypothetical protein
VEQHRLPSSELADLTYKRHVVVINIGLLWHCEPESRPALLVTGCMGRHYQQRSPFTSYANMARQCSGREDSMVGCRAKSWCVLRNIFKIN